MPALPAFSIQKACSKAITNHGREYYTGVVYTTNRRVWEYDDRFKEYLKSTRAMAVDMETATIFTVGFANRIPTGALLLVSDRPMISDGIKTAESDKHVTQNFVKQHLEIGVEVLNNIQRKKLLRKTPDFLIEDEETNFLFSTFYFLSISFFV